MSTVHELAAEATAFLEGTAAPETAPSPTPEAEASETSEVDNNPEDAVDVEEESAESGEADGSEAEDADEPDEDSDEEESEDADSEGEDPKKPKLSAKAKWRNRAQEAEAKYGELEQDHTTLLETAETILAQRDDLRGALEAAQMRIARMEQRLREFDLGEFGSEAEARAAELELQNMELQRRSQQFEQQQQELAQQQMYARAQAEASRIKQLAEQHGVNALELYEAHRTLNGKKTLEQVAELQSRLTGARKARAAAESKLPKNQPPRKPSRGRTGTAGYKATADDVVRFLEDRENGLVD